MSVGFDDMQMHNSVLGTHLGEAHFTDDLGTDWLDRLELMIVIEDRFAHVVITDDDVNQIEVVGDLIRRIKNVDQWEACPARPEDEPACGSRLGCCLEVITRLGLDWMATLPDESRRTVRLAPGSGGIADTLDV
jgi:acyl carrier protein